MSHLVEAYSLQTGAKIKKPFVVKNFFPTPEKYITIHNSSGMGSKNYDYFQEVVDELLEHIADKDIKIVQIGTKEEPALDGCVHFQGMTTYQQTAFIIQNALLHIGNDSFPVHLASAADIPIVALYSVTTPDIAGPCFNSEEVMKNKVYCFMPDYGNNKPSFNPNEQPKTVNTIKIENIVEAALKILDIDCGYNFKSLFIGDQYAQKIIDFIPDGVISPQFAPNSVLNMRVDLIAKDKINENFIFNNLSFRKFILTLNSDVQITNFDALASVKDNILNVIIDITNGAPNKEYIFKFLEAGIIPTFLYKGRDNDYFNQSKIDFVHTPVKFVRKSINDNSIQLVKKALSDNENKNIFVKSNRVILANQQAYLSEAHYAENKSTDNKKQKLTDIKNIDKLLEESEYLFIYQKQYA